MLVAKHEVIAYITNGLFENYVNYAGSKTKKIVTKSKNLFENYVNYAGSKTFSIVSRVSVMFENYVNYAGSKTDMQSLPTDIRLRTM